MTAPIDLSIVVPIYGTSETLGACLEAVVRALAGSALRYEIVVSDDGTPGGPPRKLRDLTEGVVWLEQPTRAGFGGNVQRAVAKCQGRILCLLNSDMYVAPGFFDGILERFEDASLFAVTGRIREPGNINGGRKWLTIAAHRVRVTFASLDDPASATPGPIPYANGGGSFFRTETFRDLGGFDPLYSPYYWEDTDLGYRAWKAGYEIHYDPSRVLDHDHQRTIGREVVEVVDRILRRNQRVFIWRNLTDRPLGAVIALGFLRRAPRWVATGRIRKMAEHLSDLRFLFEIRRRRRRDRISRRRSDREVRELLAGPGTVSHDARLRGR